MISGSVMKRLLRYYSETGVSLVELQGRMVLIGSSPENDIVVAGQDIDDAAAKVEPEGEDYFLESIQKEKVRHNGKKIKRAALVLGDRIEIGDRAIVYDCCPDVAPSPCSQQDPFLAGLRKFTELIGRERDLEKLLNKLMQQLLVLFNGSDAFIFKLDAEAKPQRYVSTSSGSLDERFSDTVVQTVLTTKNGLLIGNALSDPKFSQAHSVADLKLASVICAPIMSAGAVAGIVYVGSRKTSLSFTNDDLAKLSVYASIAGMIINHVDYIGQQNRAIQRLSNQDGTSGFIAESKAMQEVLSSVKALSPSDITVLLEGPTGSGKNHVAELIHKNSRRAAKRFLVVNCSSLRGELLESELFGHKRGSFTGATGDHPGLFLAAQGGTLMLDEIGELDLPIQAKLLRALECGAVRPLGADRETPVDVRVICATNRNLAEMVKAGTFRSDLYYRINQFSVRVPPLAERGDDIELLAYFFLEKFKANYPTRDIVDFHPATLQFIRSYEWPGNIRELSNAIHRAVLSCEGPLLSLAPVAAAENAELDFVAATERFQKELIARAIKRAGGSKEEAAKLLGLSRSTFFRYQSAIGS
jgi:Nif-specific regulatory protein